MYTELKLHVNDTKRESPRLVLVWGPGKRSNRFSKWVFISATSCQSEL